jgi:hypothetical protein
VVVGDAKAPAGYEQLLEAGKGYVVLYPIAGGRRSGTLEEPDRDGELIYQVTCVGVSRDQAEWLADQVLGLLQGVEVQGYSVPRVALESDPGVRRNDEVSPPVYEATPRFRLMTTPA